MKIVSAIAVVLFSLLTRAVSPAAEIPKAPSSPAPDERYKADILLIVAHPDDETAVTGYLAKAIFDEHRRVAVIFGTRGDGGGDSMGNAQAAALGAEREIEARRALAYLGVMNVWFLNGPDTPGQDVLRSLETWNHGASLGQAVRLVRLTRPEVILTWLPAYVAGENHDDHQAAGVIATEAFDLAGDPTAFPEQVSAPRGRQSINNLTEGLLPWQPKKLYYFSDASHTDFQEDKGPKYATDGMSPARKLPYYRLAAEEMAFHLTQGDTGQMAKEALAKGDFKYFLDPVRLVFGKSLVKSAVTGDIFEGVEPSPVPFARVRGYEAPQRAGVSIELGGPWAFYQQFCPAHNVGHVAHLLTPEVAIAPGERLHVPLLIHNDTSETQEVKLTVALPAGWTEAAGSAVYSVRSHESYAVQVFLSSPRKDAPAWQEIAWKAESRGQTASLIVLRVNLAGGGLPQ